MKLFTLCAALLAGLFSLPARAQTGGIAIGAAGAPDASAVLDLKSTTRGLLLPRLTGAERKAIVGPAAGLLIFQTNNGPGVYYYDGTNWRNLTDGSLPLPDMVSTLAGSGAAGFADGTGPAAQFSSPEGVAADGSGNLYVTDRINNRIRQIVVSTGVVTTLAGSGTAGFADGPGPAAQFNNPQGMAADGSGNLFVADLLNQRIRKIVASTGVVTSLAGNGAAGSSDGTGTAAQFSFPCGVACDASGNVYVADRGNHRIRQVVAATGVVTTLAGTGAGGFADGTAPAAQFNQPTGVACYPTKHGCSRIVHVTC